MIKSFEEDNVVCSKLEKDMEGIVKFYHTKYGYGFIIAEEEKNIYVNENDLQNASYLEAGDKVRFDIEEAKKGTRAINVIRLL